MHYLIGAVVGFVTGVFVPGVIRKIRAGVAKEVATVKQDISVDANKIAKKL